MSILTSIKRSKDDLKLPVTKSYGKCELSFEKINVGRLKEKKNKTNAEYRMFRHELSGRENIKKVILLRNKNKNYPGLNIWQVRDLFDDMGFNTDVKLSSVFFSDLSAVINLGGYSVPLYSFFEKKLSNIFPKFGKLLKRKLSPGKSRLHVRMFDNGDGTWYITSHLDIHNWITLNPIKIIRSHIKEGTGDYIFGTRAIEILLKKMIESIEKDVIFDFNNIEKIIKIDSYDKNL